MDVTTRDMVSRRARSEPRQLAAPHLWILNAEVDTSSLTEQSTVKCVNQLHPPAVVDRCEASTGAVVCEANSEHVGCEANTGAPGCEANTGAAGCEANSGASVREANSGTVGCEARKGVGGCEANAEHCEDYHKETCKPTVKELSVTKPGGRGGTNLRVSDDVRELDTEDVSRGHPRGGVTGVTLEGVRGVVRGRDPGEAGSRRLCRSWSDKLSQEQLPHSWRLRDTPPQLPQLSQLQQLPQLLRRSESEKLLGGGPVQRSESFSSPLYRGFLLRHARRSRDEMPLLTARLAAAAAIGGSGVAASHKHVLTPRDVKNRSRRKTMVSIHTIF